MMTAILALLQTAAENGEAAIPKSLSPMAWFLLIFGIVVLYGGLSRSLIIAYKHAHDKDPTEEEQSAPD